jgi:hypothetical protein
MKKKIAIALVLCLVVVSIMAVPVFAKADKVALTALDNEPGSGFVIGNSCAGPASDQLTPGTPHKGAGLLRISLKGAWPDADYDVYMMVDPSLTGGVWVPITFFGPFGPLETNAQGNGNFIGDKLLGVPPGTAEVYYGLYRDGVLKFVTEIPVTNEVK